MEGVLVSTPSVLSLGFVNVNHVFCISLYVLQPFGQVPAFEDGDLTLFGEIASYTAHLLCDVTLDRSTQTIIVCVE